jgi:hypothetical protein
MACPAVTADIAFMFVERIPAGTGLDEMIHIDHYEATLDPDGFPTGDIPLPQEWLDLGKNLFEKLVETGLTDAEAGAFMSNWEQVFFGIMGNDAYYVEPLYANGAFLIYFMDRADYDRQFVLTADPPPRGSVRVGMIYNQVWAPAVD